MRSIYTTVISKNHITQTQTAWFFFSQTFFLDFFFSKVDFKAEKAFLSSFFHLHYIILSLSHAFLTNQWVKIDRKSRRLWYYNPENPSFYIMTIHTKPLLHLMTLHRLADHRHTLSLRFQLTFQHSKKLSWNLNGVSVWFRDKIP